MKIAIVSGRSACVRRPCYVDPAGGRPGAGGVAAMATDIARTARVRRGPRWGSGRMSRGNDAIYRTRRWARARSVVLNRAQWSCEKCGAVGRLEVHHLDPMWRSASDPCDPARLQALCRPCHAAAHGRKLGKRPVPRGRDAWRDWVGAS